MMVIIQQRPYVASGGDETMRYDSEHKARTRERILHEAAAAIRADGVDRIGVAALMTRAGLTHGGFYAHFGSKDELVAQAIEHMFTDRQQHLLKHHQAEDPRKALVQFIDGYLSMAHCQARDQGCPLPALAADLPRLSEAARTRYDEGIDTLLRGIANLLKRAGIADATAQATSVLAELSGALTLARARQDPRKAEAMLKVSRQAVKRRLGLSV
jgi:TetR/AcrR family transcriptional regulator, transcriptional repressor for nem operon